MLPSNGPIARMTYGGGTTGYRNAFVNAQAREAHPNVNGTTFEPSSSP